MVTEPSFDDLNRYSIAALKGMLHTWEWILQQPSWAQWHSSANQWIKILRHAIAVGDWPAFFCPFCGATSGNENDAANGYCPRCHQFFDVMELQTRLTAQRNANLAAPQHEWITIANEQHYYWERGFFFLQPLAPYSNRGRWMLGLETKGIDVDDRGWPRYFFDEANAKEEAALWLSNWLEGGFNDEEPTTATLAWRITGSDCEADLTELTKRLPMGKYFAEVRLLPDRIISFTVDRHDLFPRWFFDRDVAIGELTAWMVCRKQVFVS